MVVFMTLEILPLDELDYLSISNPLENMYIKTDIVSVMEAVIFNGKMEALKLDHNLFLKYTSKTSIFNFSSKANKVYDA